MEKHIDIAATFILQGRGSPRWKKTHLDTIAASSLLQRLVLAIQFGVVERTRSIFCNGYLVRHFDTHFDKCKVKEYLATATKIALDVGLKRYPNGPVHWLSLWGFLPDYIGLETIIRFRISIKAQWTHQTHAQ